jgi:hypothetical protein
VQSAALAAPPGPAYLVVAAAVAGATKTSTATSAAPQAAKRFSVPGTGRNDNHLFNDCEERTRPFG